MYQSIYKYAKDNGISKEKYRTSRVITAYIILDKNGNYQGAEIIPKNDRSNTTVFLPINYSHSLGNASPVCDKKQTVLGNIKHDSFISMMTLGADFCEKYNAVVTFVKKYDVDDKLRKTVDGDLKSIKDTDFISFRVENFNLEDERSCDKWFDDLMDSMTRKSNDCYGISSLTGEKVKLIYGNVKFPMMKGKSLKTGVPIFSNNHGDKPSQACAFKSYGTGSEACPMSLEEAETIQAGIEKLFSSENNHNNDFSIVFWFDDKNSKNILNPLIERKRDEKMDLEYKNILDSILSGDMVDPTEKQKNNMYHIIHYNVPDKGRFSLSREKTGTYKEMAENINKWYRDTSISISQGNVKRITSLWSVLLGLMQKKEASDEYVEIDNEFGSAKQMILESVYNGNQIPRKVYVFADEQVIKSIIYNYYETDDNKIKEKYYPWTALMVIKAYLIREGIIMKEKLDNTNSNIGYLCGRWLATLDWLQTRASDNKPNVTVGEKMYKGCTKNPAKVLNLCSENKNIYLSKVDGGKRVYIEKIFGEITELMDGRFFPEKFTELEKGAFHLGYAQQRQNFFKKNFNNDNEINVDENENE